MDGEDYKVSFWKQLPVAVQAVSGLVGAFAVFVGALVAMGYFSNSEEQAATQQEQAVVNKVDPSISFDGRGVLKGGINEFIYLRQHASYDSNRLETVSGEEVFLVGEVKDGWIPVRLKSGTEGWVEARGVQVIEDVNPIEE